MSRRYKEIREATEHGKYKYNMDDIYKEIEKGAKRKRSDKVSHAQDNTEFYEQALKEIYNYIPTMRGEEDPFISLDTTEHERFMEFRKTMVANNYDPDEDIFNEKAGIKEWHL